MKYITAKESYIRYMTVSGKSTTTIASYGSTLDRFGAFLHDQGIESIEEVKPLAITAYMDMRSEQIAPTSLNLELSHIHCMFDYLLDMEVIERNPVKKSHAVNRSALREQQNKEYNNIITREEIVSILLNDSPANTHRAQINRNRALLMVFMTTGLRNESVREMKIGDIDFENKRIKVNAAKGNKVGFAPLCDITAHFLKLYLADNADLTDDDYLFGFQRVTTTPIYLFSELPESGRLDKLCAGVVVGYEEHTERVPFSRQQMSNTVEAAIKSYLPERTGIRSHALRHSFASLISNAGMSDGEVSRLLFHSDGTGASVTRRYISDDLTDLFQKVNAIFNKLTQNFSFSA